MTGSEAREWWRHETGGWVVTDPGRQLTIEPEPASGNVGTRPDTVVDGGTVGRLTYRATSQRGLLHRQQGTPRQDAYLVRPSPDRLWLVGCVADGVSQDRHSHEAADAVCAAASKALGRRMAELSTKRAEETKQAKRAARARKATHAKKTTREEDWASEAGALPWDSALAAANAALSKAAGRRGRDTMLTTAVVFVIGVHAEVDGGHPAAVAVLAGDSGALRLDGVEWTPLSAVKNAGLEVGSSAVTPLSPTAVVRPATLVLHPGQALVVITDGVGDPLGAGTNAVGRFLGTMWAEPPPILEYAQQVGFHLKSCVDDRTAVTIWAGRP